MMIGGLEAATRQIAHRFAEIGYLCDCARFI